MSELEKAKQEVEQVCFAYDKAGDTGDIKDWKEFYDLENKLIEKVKIANQPQLTIPKSIAEQADTMEFIELQRDGLGIFQQFFDYNQHEYMDVIFAYLNPLTRHLVKVVDDGQ